MVIYLVEKMFFYDGIYSITYVVHFKPTRFEPNLFSGLANLRDKKKFFFTYTNSNIPLTLRLTSVLLLLLQDLFRINVNNRINAIIKILFFY